MIALPISELELLMTMKLALCLSLLKVNKAILNFGFVTQIFVVHTYP